MTNCHFLEDIEAYLKWVSRFSFYGDIYWTGIDTIQSTHKTLLLMIHNTRGMIVHALIVVRHSILWTFFRCRKWKYCGNYAPTTIRPSALRLAFHLSNWWNRATRSSSMYSITSSAAPLRQGELTHLLVTQRGFQFYTGFKNFFFGICSLSRCVSSDYPLVDSLLVHQCDSSS